MMKILSILLVCAGFSLILACVIKRVYGLGSLDEAYRKLYQMIKDNIKPASRVADIVNPHYVLTYGELIEIEEVLKKHFLNITFVDCQVIRGLFIASYSIAGTKQIYTDQDDILKAAITMDIWKYYRNKRGINVNGVYIKTLTKSELSFEVACTPEGETTILQLLNSGMTYEPCSPSKDLIETFGEDDNDNRI